jgi:hypothetical protein
VKYSDFLLLIELIRPQNDIAGYDNEKRVSYYVINLTRILNDQSMSQYLHKF